MGGVRREKLLHSQKDCTWNTKSLSSSVHEIPNPTTKKNYNTVIAQVLNQVYLYIYVVENSHLHLMAFN